MIETGVLFNDIHSFFDLNLILSAVEISPASPKTNYVDIPGADGALDLTEAHGEVKYSDRTIKLTFTMNPAGDLSERAWEEKKTEVSNCLNGLACKITLDKDPDYYWQGRCTVDSYISNKRLRQIVVVARVRPYKLKQTETIVTVDIFGYQTVILPNSPLMTQQDLCNLEPGKYYHEIGIPFDIYNPVAGSYKNIMHGTFVVTYGNSENEKLWFDEDGNCYVYDMTTGLIQRDSNRKSEFEVTVDFRNGRKSVCPVITCTDGDTEIVFNGNTFKFSAGQHQNLNIRFIEGINQVTISGTGQVTFTYQEGDL